MSSGKLTRCSRSQRESALNDRESSARGWSCSGVKWLVSVVTSKALVRAIEGTLAAGDRREDGHLVVEPRRPIELLGWEQVAVDEEAMHGAHPPPRLEH